MNSKKNDVSDNDDDDDDVSDEDEDDFHECKVAGDKGKSCYFVQLVVLVIRFCCLSVVFPCELPFTLTKKHARMKRIAKKGR